MKILLLTFVTILISCLAFGQINKDFLEKVYIHRNSEMLKNEFSKISIKTDSIRYKYLNDTTILISNLFSLIFKNYYLNPPNKYFFLQSGYPIITIANIPYQIDIPFCPNSGFDSLTPLLYDSESIIAINSFLGTKPTYNLKTIKKRIIKKQHKSYENKCTFISTSLLMNYSWDSLNTTFIPLNIKYLKFNKQLNSVEIQYDLTGSGETAIFELSGDVWRKTKTIMSWVE